MAMIIEKDKNVLRFDVPNSEASIDAQHYGIKDRTVGAYYMSEQYELCKDFLSNFAGEYYIDVELSIKNAKRIVGELSNSNYQNAFKQELNPQKTAIETLEWLANKGEYFYKIPAPIVNDKQKYLKLDNEDAMVINFKTLVLGDLCSIFIKKLGKNGYILYVDKSPQYASLLKNNKVLEWMI